MDLKNQHINDELLTSFLVGEVSDEDRMAVLEWLQAGEANQKHFDALEEVWLMSAELDPKPIDIDLEKAWDSIQVRMDEIEGVEQEAPTKKRFLNTRYWLAAASVILIGALYFTLFSDQEEQEFLLANNTIETQFDTLTDGSVIHLSQGAQLSYTESFNGNDRRVKLKGKAFFDIARDTTKSFVIDAGIGGVQVLGTSFSVEIEHDSDVVVDVKSGIVRLFMPVESADTMVLVLNAGESGIISFAEQKISKIISNPSALYWVDKSLRFKNKTFEEVVDVLEKVYEVSFEVKDEHVMLLPVSAKFEDASIEEIIEVLSSTFDFSYEFVDQKNILIESSLDE
jgi:ferric-dicitrate binding protein FerR (iron transport regulator)